MERLFSPHQDYIPGGVKGRETQGLSQSRVPLAKEGILRESKVD